MASAAPLEALLSRERLGLAAALAAVAVLAWIGMFYMAVDMDAPGSAVPAHWTAGYFAAMFVMWAVMMAAMMVPSVAPTVLLFAALRRAAGHSFRETLAFTGGYLVAWSAFSLLATAAQWRLAEAWMLSPDMRSESATFAGLLFVAAGIYQFTPLKQACLAKCRAPAQFLVAHRRDGKLGALVMGIEHGVFCIGCCWALMALLFAFGVMNLLWVAAIAAFVLVEKLFPGGRGIAATAGAVLVALGLFLMNA